MGFAQASPGDRNQFLPLCDYAETKLGLKTDAADLLILQGETMDAVQSLYFRGGPENREVIEQHARALAQPTSRSSLFTIALGRHTDFVELWVTDTHKADPELLSDAVDALLDDLLTANRPVADWRASYFMPVRLPDVFPPAEWLETPQPGDEEQNYFLESAARLLGDKDGTGLSSWTKSAPTPATLCVQNPLYDEPLSAAIDAVRLHRFGTDGSHGLLEWAVTGAVPASPQQPVLWRRYLDEATRWSFAQFLDFHAAARFAKHHYPRDEDVYVNGFETVRLSKRNTTTMRDLLEQIDALNDVIAIRDGNDRAWAMASVILDGAQAKVGGLDPLLASLACVDPYEPGGFYDDQFAQQEFAASQYRRFWNKGTHFMATSHSFAMLGYRQDKREIQQGKRSFVESFVHNFHMKFMYHRLYRLSLFQQQGLDDIGDQLSKRSAWDEHLDELDGLRKQWIDMRASRWFNRVSTQLQGEELYALLRRAMGIDDEVALIDKKLSDLDALYHARAKDVEEHREKTLAQDAEVAERRARFLEWVVLPIAIFIAIRETMYTGGDEYAEALTQLFEGFMSFFRFGNAFYSICAVALLIASIVWLYLAAGKVGTSWLYVIRRNLKTSLFIVALFAGALALAWTQPRFVHKETKEHSETNKGSPTTKATH